MTGRNVSEYFVRPNSTIGEAIACIDRSGRVSIALVVDEEGRLLNTISDGDVRRGILAGLNLSHPVTALLEIKARTPYPVAVTAPASTEKSSLLALMQQRSVRQLPLVDESGRIVDIVILQDLLPEALGQFQAVVMAGGQGARLRPLTENMPKPMLPIDGRPLMELIVEQLRDVGVKHINVTTHYQADKIMSHFGDGGAFGVEINYVQEETPLGTGGALGLLKVPEEPLLVINGDILTQVDFRAMFAFHQEHAAHMTVAVRRYEMQVPYGVIDCNGVSVCGLREKPNFTFFVNAGIYLLEPAVFEFIPNREHFNMTDLIARLLQAERTVVSFPVREYWLDIGQHEQYIQAQADAKDGKLRRSTAL